MYVKRETLYEAKVCVLKEMCHPKRLWTVEQFADSQRCACELVKEATGDFLIEFKHFSMLKQVGIVENDKRGKQVPYRLKIPCALNFMQCVENALRNRIQDQMEILYQVQRNS